MDAYLEFCRVLGDVADQNPSSWLAGALQAIAAYSPAERSRTLDMICIELFAAWGEAYLKFEPRLTSFPALFVRALSGPGLHPDPGVISAALADFLNARPCDLDAGVSRCVQEDLKTMAEERWALNFGRPLE